MRIKKQSSRKLIILATLAAIIILSGAAGLYFLYISQDSENLNSSPNTLSSDEKDRASNSDSTNPQAKDAISGGSTSPNVDTTKTTDAIPKSDSVSVEIVELENSTGSVVYSARATGASTATCSAVFTHDLGKPVTRTTETTNGACGPVSIPALEFDALGTWTLTLRYYTNNTQAVAAKTLEVQ